MVNESKKYWEKFWINQDFTEHKESTNSWYKFVVKSNHDSILKIIKDNFKNLNNLNMIEVGCGSAKFTKYMIDEINCNYTISDLNENILRRTKKIIQDSQNRNIKTSKIDLSKTNNFKDSYDVVFSGGVLEFFKDIENPIKNMFDLTNENGICIAIVIPRKISSQSLGNIQKSIIYFFRDLIKKRKIPKKIFYSHLDKNTYINSYSYSYYEKIFINSGFKSVRVFSLVPFPSFAIGKKLDIKYANLLNNKFKNVVDSFNNSSNVFNKFIGSSYLIYAKKN